MSRVCFVTPGVYPMLRGIGCYGGSELRAWRLARDLAARSICKVSMLGFDYGQREVEVRESVEFLRDSRHVYASGLIPKLRWFAHRIARRKILVGSPLLHEQEYAAWEAANADVYITFGATNYSARLARWCQIRNRHFILLHGSDMDLDPLEDQAASIYNFPGLSISQTEYQAKELKRRFGRASTILLNPVVIPPEGPFLEPREYALWVGKSDRIKCPDRMVDLAGRCPHIPIVMIMNCADVGFFDAIKAGAPDNVTFVDAVPPHVMQSYYQRAFTLVSTSKIEGFANSFLEASACGTPIVSLDVDPDSMLSEHKAGILTGAEFDPAVVLDALYSQRHWAPGSRARVLGENGYHYVTARHDQAGILDRFAAIITTELERVV